MTAGKDAAMVARCDEQRGHSLYPTDDELAAGTIPKLYKTERIPLADKLIVLHYFVGPADWWITEYDPDDRLCFGYCCLGDRAEWGYVSLDELAVSKVRPGNWPMDMVVERDLYWTPIRFAELDR